MPFLKKVDGHTFQLKPGSNLLGRSGDQDVILGHVTVSRKHARIDVTSDGAFIEDLGSQNGVWLNAELLVSGTEGRRQLAPGDRIAIAVFELVYHDGDPPRDHDTDSARRDHETPRTKDEGLRGFTDDSRDDSGDWRDHGRESDYSPPPDPHPVEDDWQGAAGPAAHYPLELYRTLLRIRVALKTKVITYDGAFLSDIQQLLSARDERACRTLGAGFHRLMSFDAAVAMSAPAGFDLVKFEHHVVQRMTEVFDYNFGSERFHTAEIAQYLRDAQASLFCFLNVGLFTHEAFRRIRGLGFMDARHRTFYCGTHPYLRERSFSLVTETE